MAKLSTVLGGNEVQLHLVGNPPVDTSAALTDSNAITVSSIGPMPDEFELATWTNHGDDDAQQYPTKRAARNIDLELRFVQSDTNHTDLEQAYRNKSERTFALAYLGTGGTPDGQRIDFAAFVVKFERQQEQEDVVVVMATLAINGTITVTDQ